MAEAREPPAKMADRLRTTICQVCDRLTMVAQAFEYRTTGELCEALELLDEHGEDAKILAGGQSLVPMMHLRLARPEVVLDINRLPGLAQVSVVDGEVRLGALVRHRHLERLAVEDPLGRLLATSATCRSAPAARSRAVSRMPTLRRSGAWSRSRSGPGSC